MGSPTPLVASPLATFVFSDLRVRTRSRFPASFALAINASTFLSNAAAAAVTAAVFCFRRLAMAASNRAFAAVAASGGTISAAAALAVATRIAAKQYLAVIMARSPPDSFLEPFRFAGAAHGHGI